MDEVRVESRFLLSVTERELDSCEEDFVDCSIPWCCNATVFVSLARLIVVLVTLTDSLTHSLTYYLFISSSLMIISCLDPHFNTLDCAMVNWEPWNTTRLNPFPRIHNSVNGMDRDGGVLVRLNVPTWAPHAIQHPSERNSLSGRRSWCLAGWLAGCESRAKVTAQCGVVGRNVLLLLLSRF